MRTWIIGLVLVACSAPPPRAEPEIAAPTVEIAQPLPEPVALPEEEPVSAPPPAAALLEPGLATEIAPEQFAVRVQTTKGAFTVELTRAWAPQGVDRFYNLVRIGFFRDVAFYRAIKGFMVQFGLHGDPAVNRAWKRQVITPDPVFEKNSPLTVAQSGAHDRTVQLFINWADNPHLDGMGFAPIGRVVAGMSIVESLHTGYGGKPVQHHQQIASQGNSYLRQTFPDLDYIVDVTLITRTTAP